MNRNAILVITTVSAAAIAVVVYGLFVGGQSLGAVCFWLAVGATGEYFWVQSADRRSITSYGVSILLATVFILGPWSSMATFFGGTFLGIMLFRKSEWYKALFNAAQMTIAALVAGQIWYAYKGPFLPPDTLSLEGQGISWLSEILSRPELVAVYLLAMTAFMVVNTFLIGVLFQTIGITTVPKLFAYRFRDPQEIQGLTATWLTPLLLILIYGMFGVLGIGLFFFVLGLEKVANARYVSLLHAQDELVRGERMAAMGDLAEEVGLTLGDHLRDLSERTVALRRQVERLADDNLTRSLGIIDENVEHMATLVDGITAFRNQEMRRSRLDLNALVQRTIEFMRPQNRFDGITLLSELPPSLPEVEVDGGQIQQVLINLLANAADALREAGSPDPRIFVSTRVVGNGQVVLTVEDNGPGIPEENLGRVFEPHFTTKATGHGFGLATSFKIIRRHGGDITARNLPDRGAEFRIDLEAA